VYADDKCSFGFASCSAEGGVFPEHIHDGVHEYLICITGSFMETFGPNGKDGIRIVKEKECVSVPPNILHSSKPLENNTRLVYICIPRDRTIE
jgi:mannose-6-phosphate isomerase-like protein (cupin superfamily)